MQRHRLMTAWTLAVLVCAGVGVGAKGPPVNAAPPGPARLVGRRGRSVRFVCPLRADPEPIVEWYRDGERVTKYWGRHRVAGYSLTVKQLGCDDQGTYLCRAINGFGVNEIAFHLDVFDSKEGDACSGLDEDEAPLVDAFQTVRAVPVILQRHKIPKHLLKPAQSHASIKCLAAAVPAPHIRWFKDGVEITRNKKYAVRSAPLARTDADADADDDDDDDDDNVDEDQRQHRTVRSVMQISHLTGSDSANYTCRAENVYGSTEATFFLEVVERQVPRCPELHPHHPANGSFAGGQTGALICKAKSEFPPGLYWLKRIADPGVAAPPPPVHHDVCDAVATPDMTPNRTLSMGKDRYQILSSPPAVKMADGYFLSKLIFSDLDAENDTGFYVCLVLNNAGLVYREVYMDVSNSAPTKPPVDGVLWESDSESDSSPSSSFDMDTRADTTTTAVVIFVIIVGIGTIVAVCFAWKRRSQHVKESFLHNVAAPKTLPPAPAPVRPTPTGSSESATLLLSAPPASYAEFREGIVASADSTGAKPVECGVPAAVYSPPMAAPTYGVTHASGPGSHSVYFVPQRAPRAAGAGRPPAARWHRSTGGGGHQRPAHRSSASAGAPPPPPPPSLSKDKDGHSHGRSSAVRLPNELSQCLTTPRWAAPASWRQRPTAAVDEAPAMRLARPSPETSFDSNSLLV